MMKKQKHIIQSKLNDDQLFKFKKRRIIVIWIVFFLLFISSDLIRAYYHESTHETIYNMAGISSHMGFKIDNILMVAFYVQADNQTIARERCGTLCASLQESNEIETYNLSCIFYSIWILSAILLLNKQIMEYTL